MYQNKRRLYHDAKGHPGGAGCEALAHGVNQPEHSSPDKTEDGGVGS